MEQQDKDMVLISKSMGKMIYILEEHGFIHSSICDNIHEICSSCRTLNMNSMIEGFLEEAADFNSEFSKEETIETIQDFIKSNQ